MSTTTTQKPKRFERPVTIRAGGDDRVVSDVNAAAEILLRVFPRETARRRVAMAVCLAAIRGEARPPEARRAFVSAAFEAGILAAD